MKLIIQTFLQRINGKLAFTTSKMGAQLISKSLGVTLRASTYDYVNKRGVGGSTSPVEGHQFYFFLAPEDNSPSIEKVLMKKFKDGAYIVTEVNDSFEVQSFEEPLTASEFSKANLKLTERVGLSVN